METMTWEEWELDPTIAKKNEEHLKEICLKAKNIKEVLHALRPNISDQMIFFPEECEVDNMATIPYEELVKYGPANMRKEGNKMKRAEILEKAKECVCGQREQDYGTPEDNFTKIADLWNGYLGGPVVNATDVAMMMALLKIARIKSGTATEDSFVDLAGYAACGGEIKTDPRVVKAVDPFAYVPVKI